MSILVPRNIEGRKDKLNQINIKLLQQEVIDDELLVDESFKDIDPSLVKVKEINGDLLLRDWTSIPTWFKNIKVNGNFVCAHLKLTTLENCPKIINKGFSCSGNELTSLEGGPKYVGTNYWCSGNKVKLHPPNDCKIIGNFIN